MLTTAFVEGDTRIALRPPRQARSSIDDTPVAVPWVIVLGSDSEINLHVGDTATLTRLRDEITAALERAS